MRLDLTSRGTGTAHQLTRSGKSTITFNPATPQFTLVPANATAQNHSDEVIYERGAGTNIGASLLAPLIYVIVQTAVILS